MQLIARLAFLSLFSVALLGLVPSASFASSEAGAHEAGTHEAGGHGHATGAPTVNWVDLGFKGKDAAGGELDKGEESMAPPMLFAILNFAIFALILYFKAGPALTKYFATRHETIKDALEEAAKLQAAAKDKLKEYSSRIADADAEVNALIEQIRRDAEEERNKLVADAKRQAERMKVDAEARIDSEFLGASREIERDVVDNAAELA